MGQVVQIIGEAGLGKSRLVYTLKQHLRTQAPALGARRCPGGPASCALVRRNGRRLGHRRVAMLAAAAEQQLVSGHRLLRAAGRHTQARIARRADSIGWSGISKGLAWRMRKPFRCSRRCCPCRSGPATRQSHARQLARGRLRSQPSVTGSARMPRREPCCSSSRTCNGSTPRRSSSCSSSCSPASAMRSSRCSRSAPTSRRRGRPPPTRPRWR